MEGKGGPEYLSPKVNKGTIHGLFGFQKKDIAYWWLSH